LANQKAMMMGKFDMKGLVHTPHPSYSPDLSSCDFWLIGTANEKMKDRKFHTVQDIRGRLRQIRNDLTFEDIQSVFLEWKIRLNWVIGNRGAYYSE
jgi:proteasome lid subunit RPN8/RPN11